MNNAWKDDPRWAYLFVNLATLLWASNIMLGRALRDQIGPLTLTASRFTIASLLFSAFIFKGSGDQTSLDVKMSIKRNWKLLAGMGLTGAFTFPTLLYFALKSTLASNASLINGTAPLVTTFIAAMLLDEKISVYRILCALISLIGVALIISGRSLDNLASLQIRSGDLIVLFDVLIWGLYSTLGRITMRAMPAIVATGLSTLFALPFLLLSAGLEWFTQPAQISFTLILAILYIGIFPTFIGFLSWNEGVKRVGPTRAMAFYNMLPVFGVLLGVLILQEQISWLHVFGGLLIILGGVASLLPNLSEKRILPKPG